MNLYLNQNGLKLCKNKRRLVVKKGNETINESPIFDLDTIVIFGNCQITNQALGMILKTGVPVYFCYAHGGFKGKIVGRMDKNIFLRIDQFKRCDDQQFCVEQAKEIVKAKLKNQRHILRRRNYRNRLGIGDKVHKFTVLLNKLERTNDMDKIRGYEGTGASTYFSCFEKLFLNDNFKFEKRTRRPPADPVNAMLSFGYSLLYNYIESLVEEKGFDPGLGVFHQPAYGRPALALDITEEFRQSIIDRLVLNIINNRVLKPEDFDRNVSKKYPVLLSKEGKSSFLDKFNEMLNSRYKYKISDELINKLPYREIMRKQVEHFARVIKGEDPVYQPFYLR